jgi:hypothetical protein
MEKSGKIWRSLEKSREVGLSQTFPDFPRLPGFSRLSQTVFATGLSFGATPFTVFLFVFGAQ